VPPAPRRSQLTIHRPNRLIEGSILVGLTLTTSIFGTFAWELFGSFERTAYGGDLVSHLIDLLTGLGPEAQSFELIDFTTPNACGDCLQALDDQHEDDGSVEVAVDELLEV
jgi:hypothetical protein